MHNCGTEEKNPGQKTRGQKLGQQLPLLSDGLDEKLMAMFRPFIAVPCAFSIAFDASSWELNTTNANLFTKPSSKQHNEH